MEAPEPRIPHPQPRRSPPGPTCARGSPLSSAPAEPRRLPAVPRQPPPDRPDGFPRFSGRGAGEGPRHHNDSDNDTARPLPAPPPGSGSASGTAGPCCSGQPASGGSPGKGCAEALLGAGTSLPVTGLLLIALYSITALEGLQGFNLFKSSDWIRAPQILLRKSWEMRRSDVVNRCSLISR